MANTSTTKTNGSNTKSSELSKLDEVKQTIGASIQNLRKLLKASREPLPTQTGNGTQLPAEEHYAGLGEKFATAIRDATTAGWGTLEKVIEAGEGMANGKPIDDKKYLMEYLIQIAAKIPDDVVSNKITDTMITTLWQDLDHPPETLMGGEFEFRQPDGSNNCYKNPMIGAAHMPYARTVKPKTLQPGQMPDPGVLFDTLMARKEPKEHPNRISSMLFYLASIIIHDCFKTSHTDYRYSDTSSYLDLAPLYGSDWKDQKRMRTFKDGKIKPDCFSETRLLSFPPGVGCLLIMFNRYHNYVAEQLAAINEGGRFTPSEKTVDRYGEKGLNKRDDDLFQTARLVTCGLYVNIILVDYVRTILNLNRTDSNWQLNPRKDIKDGPDMATGNQVSAEFNLIYRWHASISKRDEKWTQELSDQMWAGKNMSEVPQYEIMKTLSKTEQHLQSLEPDERPFPALERETMTRIQDGPYKGNFKDDELAEFLTAGIEDCANAMGPQQVPICLRAIEILGIQQARTWQLATLNELREHFGLERHREFSDITGNKEVAEALKHLYDTPDNVELYPGLVVEDAKNPMAPGSGLCPSYTTSRGVLSDATALVRGDRFYTTAFTPAQYTNWGYQECQSDLTIDNGCVLYKLFLRTLPNNFDPSSVYVHYPFTVPSEMKTILQDLGKDHKYNFERPKPIPKPEMIFTYDAATKIMQDQDKFKTTWGKAMVFLMGPEANKFMLAGDEPVNAESRKLIENVLYQGESSRVVIPRGNEKWLQEVKTFYENITTKLLQQKSYKLGAMNQVDLVRDVGNLAHVHFSAELFNLPLKTEEHPTGLFTEQQLYLIMAAIFICIFFDVDPAKSFPLRQQAREVVQQLGEIVKLQVTAIQKGGELAKKLLTAVRPTTDSPLKDYGVHMIAQLLKKDSDIDSLVWGNIMETAGSMVATQGQLLAQSMDYIFNEGKEHIPTLKKLAQSDSDEDFDTLTHYFMEFSRLAGETALFRHVAKPTTVVDGTRTHELKEGDEVMINLKAASRDPKAFPNPNVVDPTRPMDSYIHLGHGPHQCLGLPIVRVACTTMLRKFFQLENLRPATVSVGRSSVPSSVKKLVKEFVPGDSKTMPEGFNFHVYMMEDWDMFFPFPTSLKVNWDGEVPIASDGEASIASKTTNAGLSVPYRSSQAETVPVFNEPTMTLAIPSQGSTAAQTQQSPLTQHQKFLMVTNLAMQCSKCLLNTTPPRTKGPLVSTSSNYMPLRGSQFSQSEVRGLTLRCICPFSHKDDSLVFCWRCVKSQHANCYYPRYGNELEPADEGNAMCHECLHCEKVTGSLREPAIANAAKVRQAGHALRTWCGDLGELGLQGEMVDDAAWENAAMLLGLLVKLMIYTPHVADRCGQAVRLRMKHHFNVMAERMLRFPREDGFASGNVRGIESDPADDQTCCPEEEFGGTALGLVQGLVELLPIFVGV